MESLLHGDARGRRELYRLRLEGAARRVPPRFACMPIRQVSGGHPISRLLMHCLGVLLARIVCLHRDCCKNFFNDPFFQIP